MLDRRLSVFVRRGYVVDESIQNARTMSGCLPFPFLPLFPALCLPHAPLVVRLLWRSRQLGSARRCTRMQVCRMHPLVLGLGITILQADAV